MYDLYLCVIGTYSHTQWLGNSIRVRIPYIQYDVYVCTQCTVYMRFERSVYTYIIINIFIIILYR